ncbi:MAG: GIY-YIG nuclease family protein [Clostridia bacterium]|nr:GIY-YIG nuclease family protein [Clostridia bacterium]
MGYIYIMTNPSFEEYVKIGYAKDVKQRLAELNRSSAVPFAFRVYATYEVDSELSDKKVHSILDKLNPKLRSMEEINGKKRVREFYAMTPQDAYDILEAIAEINGFKHRLKKWKATAEEQKAEETAKEISEAHNERLSPFAFSTCNIAVGEQVEFCFKDNPMSGKTFTVVDDKHVEFNDEKWSLSALAEFFVGKKPLAGPRHFKYNGEWLYEIRRKTKSNDGL